MAKIYVATLSVFVMGAHRDLEALKEAVTPQGLAYADHDRHEWVPEDYCGLRLKYVNSGTGRWNKTDWLITEVELPE